MTRPDNDATRHLLGAFVSLTTGIVFVRVVSFAASIVVIRMVGPSDFGAFTVGLTLATLFALCVNPGLDDFLVREIARAQEDIGPLIGDAVLTRIPALPLGLLGGLFIESVAHTRGMYLFLAVYAAGHTYLLLISAILRGRGRMRQQAVLLSAHMTLTAVASIAACMLTRDIVWVAATYAGATAIALAAGYVLLVRMGTRPRYGWRVVGWTRLARASATFGATLVGVLLLDRQALMWLGLVGDPAHAGWFSSVYNLVLAMSNLPMAAAAVALPHMARLAQRNLAELDRFASKIIRLTIVLSLPLALGVHLLAPVAVPLLFGPDYQPSVWVMQSIAFSIPAWFLTLVLVSILEAVDHQASCAAGVLQSLLVATPVVLFATWRFGLEGAAVGYVVAHVVLTAMLAWRTHQALRAIGLRRGWRNLVWPTPVVAHG
jgi:O-antigen/teichoic acid export membrane protein